MLTLGTTALSAIGWMFGWVDGGTVLLMIFMVFALYESRT